MRRFGIDETDVGAVRIVECGLHHGFPLCCILLYVKLWAPWIATVPDVCEEADFDFGKMRSLVWVIHPALEAGLVRQWAYLDQYGGVGYIRCPACILSGKVVMPRQCAHFDFSGDQVGAELTTVQAEG